MSVALMKLSPVVAMGVIIAFELEPGEAAAVSAGELFIVGTRANGSNFGKSAEATPAGSAPDADVDVGSAAADDVAVEPGSVIGVAAGADVRVDNDAESSSGWGVAGAADGDASVGCAAGVSADADPGVDADVDADAGGADSGLVN